MAVQKNLNHCFIKGLRQHFVLFKRTEQVKPFVDYMNSKHKNINFSFKTEKKMGIFVPFVDVNVFGENDKFVTNV